MSDEQLPPQPENSTLSSPAGEARALPAPTQRGGGCVGRFLAALLIVIITTFLALVAGATGLLYLGVTPAMPRQVAEAQAQIATLQAQNGSLLTQVAAHEQRGATDHEVLGDLKRQVDDIADLREQLRQERENSAAQSATLVAEVRSGRDSVALFATAEASRAALLAELERRSARVERFLQRLGDIANDTALDLGSSTPAIPTLAPAETLTPTPAPLATLAATLEPTPTAAPSATAKATATAAPTTAPSATPRASATPTRSANATPRPTTSPTSAPSP